MQRCGWSRTAPFKQVRCTKKERRSWTFSCKCIMCCILTAAFTQLYLVVFDALHLMKAFSFRTENTAFSALTTRCSQGAPYGCLWQILAKHPSGFHRGQNNWLSCCSIEMHISPTAPHRPANTVSNAKPGKLILKSSNGRQSALFSFALWCTITMATGIYSGRLKRFNL